MNKVICPSCKGTTRGDFLTWKYCPLCGIEIKREKISMKEVFETLTKEFPEVKINFYEERD